MKVVLDVAIKASPKEAQAALLEPAFYQSLGQLGAIAAPEVRSISRTNKSAHLVLHYRFAGQLNGIARSMLDPDKLTWVQETEVDLARLRTQVRMVPDNYEQLISFNGWYELRRSEGRKCTQHFEADLRVHLPLVGPLAERAITSSIRDNVVSTAKVLERYLAARGRRLGATAGNPRPRTGNA